jgi:hypothetical protein
MTTSLMELLETDLGAGSVKTAGVAVPTFNLGDDVSIEKIAHQLGLFGDSEKVAEFPPKKDDDKEDDDKKDDKKNPFAKEAAAGYGGLFETLFPTDSLGGATKVASELTKEAAAEEALGARTFDHYAERFDQRMGKLAFSWLKGWKKCDGEATNQVDNNKGQRDAGGGPINTAPHITNEIKPENGGAVVGREGSGGNVKAAAVRQHLLLSSLES